MLKQELKKGKNIFLIIILGILLTIPFGNYVYHRSLYYLIIIFVIIPLTFYRIIKNYTLEKKFYFKWGKKRKKGSLYNMTSGFLGTIFTMLIIVFSSQYIVNGRTPSFILSILSMNQSIKLTLILLVFGAISGIVAWYENEKRYKNIYLNSQDNEILEHPPTEYKKNTK